MKHIPKKRLRNHGVRSAFFVGAPQKNLPETNITHEPFQGGQSLFWSDISVTNRQFVKLFPEPGRLNYYGLVQKQSLFVCFTIIKLVGGFNPSEKYARQIGSFPQGSGWTLKKYLSCHHFNMFFVCGIGGFYLCHADYYQLSTQYVLPLISSGCQAKLKNSQIGLSCFSS